MAYTNLNLHKCGRWMQEKSLKLAQETIEMLILSKKRAQKSIPFEYTPCRLRRKA